MARLVEGSLGPPIAVEQLNCDESPIATFNDGSSNSQFSSWQQACVTITSTVRIMFELRPRKDG